MDIYNPNARKNTAASTPQNMTAASITPSPSALAKDRSKFEKWLLGTYMCFADDDDMPPDVASRVEQCYKIPPELVNWDSSYYRYVTPELEMLRNQLVDEVVMAPSQQSSMAIAATGAN
ncbi:hypothetical protein FRB94_011762 [Tulasnella sp. JGI-2019a]|nr:hypothetical protein FRB93_002209 [Tulasnella sp. JGI-2019a]KAG9014584.1 hypothetical protein FRB94_011762 [Tulasnella sp. JGI-2019a]KAG9038919.1 hypothetical protein FRB95_013597 [Tulasnella sp. JGI-2019a]